MYSQRDEERVILEFFNGAFGRFLDIGAYDGRTFSTTLALCEMGWVGTLVEASPHAFIALKHTYRPEVRGTAHHLVHALLGFDWTLKKFWDSPDAIATDDPAHMEKWKSLGQYRETWVPELPLAELLRVHPGPFEFINIDVEGVMTERLFRAMPFAKLGCRLVCVEVNDEVLKFQEIARTHPHGKLFQVHQTAENILFKVL